jgi:CheY-like chemotaxis protein
VINDILLSDVLAHAKVDSKAAALEQKDFDLRNAIEEVFDVFASQTATANIELVYQVDHRIPSQVIGDSTRLRQVLMNLVENAIKFTQQGDVFVKVRVRNEDANMMDLGFEIHDSGIGISPDQVDYLMSSISRADAIHSGVGLVLCHRLVDIMGGSMKIESRLKEGTVVHFNLKVSVSSHTLRFHPDMLGLEGKKVLIVEDNATLRSVLKEEIALWKLTPVVAESGKQALEILSHESSIDLVLAEMQMPEMNGAELSQRIRKLFPVLPIILISTVSNEESYEDIFSSVVHKPIRHSILSQHILSGLVHKGEMKDKKVKMSADFATKNPMRILIAEDNRVNQKLAVRILGKLGYDPDIVEDGKEALEEVSKVNYDLILMDVQMPEMDGLEATRMIRLCLSAQPVIIAMTANSMQGDREECINAGMDDYISKPVNIDELVIMLEKWALQVKAKR